MVLSALLVSCTAQHQPEALLPQAVRSHKPTHPNTGRMDRMNLRNSEYMPHKFLKICTNYVQTFAQKLFPTPTPPALPGRWVGWVGGESPAPHESWLLWETLGMDLTCAKGVEKKWARPNAPKKDFAQSPRTGWMGGSADWGWSGGECLPGARPARYF